MKNILLVGGAGYIGSHCAKQLSRQGYHPVVLDNLIYGHREAVKWGPLIESNLGNSDLVRRVLREHRIEAVMHFAAFAYVGESVQDPGKYYHNNVVETLALLDSMRAEQVNYLVFSSTCATYGIPTSIPILESEAQNPVNPYGRSKLMVEQILQDYEQAYGLKSACLRYFNAAGADPECEIGERHNPETHLIPLLLQAATGEIPYVTLFGSDYETPDGTCIRDYIHVTDLAEAHILALKKLNYDKKNLLMNLGNGQGYSNHQVIKMVETVTGKKVPIQLGLRRPGDPPKLVGSAELARSALGWRPLYPDLDSIIRHAWAWYQKQSS